MVDIGIPQVNFYSMLSGLGDTLQANAQLRQQQQVLQARKDAFSSFSALDPSSPDYGKQAMTVAQKLGSVGDQDGALKFLTLAQTAAEKTQANARDQRDFAFRQTESQRAQSNADRTFNKEKYTIKEQTDPNTGATTFVRVNTEGPEGVISTGAPPIKPNNPFSNGKMTTDQAKSGTMVDRMNDANNVITKNENINDGIEGRIGGMAAASPTIRDSSMFNYFASPARQATVQAQRNFVNAILRVESGAAISEGEFNNAQRQYFPQPGDSQTVIEQKRQNRISAMRGMAREAGPSYRPPSEIVPQGGQPQSSAVTAPPGAIAALKANPSLQAQFEAKYGPGSAAAVLGQ